MKNFIKILVAASAMVPALLSSTPAVADGQPPTLTITTDWGMAFQSEYNELYDDTSAEMHGAGGLIATVRRTRSNHSLFADGHVLTMAGKDVVDMDPASVFRGKAIFPPAEVVWSHDPALVP